MKKFLNRRAFVTGATGYIGSKLLQRLFMEGWDVHVLTRRPEVIESVSQISGKQIHAYDGSRSSILSGLRVADPTVVFHLASLFVAEHRNDQVDDLINSNVLFGTQLIDACVEVGVKRFINTGTSWQHYRGDEYDPVCLYAATKQAFEDILRYYADAHQTRIATLKLFDVYGPADPRPKLMNLLLRALRCGERLEMTAGEQLLDLVHVDDVTQAYISCAEWLDETTDTGLFFQFPISSGSLISVRDLVKIITRQSGKALNVTFGARQYRSREVMRPWQGGENPVWWKPRIALVDGLRWMLD